jgi:glycosyltransferase involved in cell wall biosynthesis
MEIEVSFVITVYNKAPYLKNTIFSILRQFKIFNCEFIFVDDYSTDNSIEIM